jgi:hypothetical protein
MSRFAKSDNSSEKFLEKISEDGVPFRREQYSPSRLRPSMLGSFAPALEDPERDFPAHGHRVKFFIINI